MEVLILTLAFLFLCNPNAQASETIPILDESNVKYFLPANDWGSWEIYNLKSFVMIPLTSNSKIDLYEDKNFKGSPKYSLTSHTFMGSSQKCDFKIIDKRSNERADFRCGYHFCNKFNMNSLANNLLSNPFEFVENNKTCETPFQISTFYVPSGFAKLEVNNSKRFVYLSVSEIESKHNRAIIRWKNENLYFDLSKCKNEDCLLVEKKTSIWEDKWSTYLKHKAAKDLDVLNYLIKNLLPCVQSKNLPCISKFFFNSETKSQSGVPPYMEGDFNRGDELEIQFITDDLLKELEACLSYESILPHLLALKGINKVCIPVTDLKQADTSKKYNFMIDNVTFPEAVRSNISRDFVFMKGKK